MTRNLTEPEANARRSGEWARVAGAHRVDGYHVDGFVIYEAVAEGGVVRRHETMMGKGTGDRTRYAFIPADIAAAQARLRALPRWDPETDYAAHLAECRTLLASYDADNLLCQGCRW